MTGDDLHRCPTCDAPVRARTAVDPESARLHPCGCRIALATDGGTTTEESGYTRVAIRARYEIARLAHVHSYTTRRGDRTPLFRHAERVQVVAATTDRDPEQLRDATHTELNTRLAEHCGFPAPERAHLTANELRRVRNTLQASYPGPTPVCPACDRLTTPEYSTRVVYPDGSERAVCEPCLTALELDAALAFTDDGGGARLLPSVDTPELDPDSTPTQANTDDELRPDGGSKYVRETGAGYLGVHRVGTQSLEIHLGQAPVTWPANTEVPAVATDRGVALLPPDADPSEPITEIRITTRASSGPYLTVKAAVCNALSVTSGDDVRLYERPDGPGLLLVPAATDPLCADGTADHQ